MCILLALREAGDLEVTKEERLEKLKQLLEKYPKRYMDVVEIGEFTYGKPIVRKFDNTTMLKIGKFCSIADDVEIILGGEHHTDRITTYPFDVLIDGDPTASKGDVIIGNDVWIGENVTILSGVVIGDGAVIGAGSVVSSDVYSYAVMAGNPAKRIRWRMNDIVKCERVWRTKWWDWPLEKIAEFVIPDDWKGVIGNE